MTAKQAAQKGAPWGAALGALVCVIASATGYPRVAIVAGIIGGVASIVMVMIGDANTTGLIEPVPQATSDARDAGTYGGGGSVEDIEGYATEGTKSL